MADLHALPQDKGAADLVLPSKLGGMLASGKPIVVTADPGTELADFLGDAAMITPPGDAATLAAAIASCQRPERDLGRQKRLRLALRLSRREGLTQLVSGLVQDAQAGS
ncbi:MAG: hypothetical protein H5U11_08250 [Rhizobium sp.]|nr:hypothetical protein [Rhizobium sp.]